MYLYKYISLSEVSARLCSLCRGWGAMCTSETKSCWSVPLSFDYRTYAINARLVCSQTTIHINPYISCGCFFLSTYDELRVAKVRVSGKIAESERFRKVKYETKAIWNNKIDLGAGLVAINPRKSESHFVHPCVQ